MPRSARTRPPNQRGFGDARFGDMRASREKAVGDKATDLRWLWVIAVTTESPGAGGLDTARRGVARLPEGQAAAGVMYRAGGRE